ncbi:MAG: hypothetical protein V1808_00490 [Candidatus Daviesbacteria bacterium]
MEKKQTVFIGVGIGIGIAIVLVVVFLLGIYLGSRKSNNFPFWEKRPLTAREFVPDRFGHGVIGTIDSLGNNTLIVKDRSGALKTIIIDDQTALRRNESPIKFSDLKKDEQVIIIGQPQEKEGSIKATVIRVVTPPEKNASGSATPLIMRPKRGPFYE